MDGVHKWRIWIMWRINLEMFFFLFHRHGGFQGNGWFKKWKIPMNIDGNPWLLGALEHVYTFIFP